MNPVQNSDYQNQHDFSRMENSGTENQLFVVFVVISRFPYPMSTGRHRSSSLISGANVASHQQIFQSHQQNPQKNKIQQQQNLQNAATFIRNAGSEI